MELFDNFTVQDVCMGLEADERDAALQEMVNILVKSGRIGKGDLDTVLVELVRRETLGTTAIGRAMALPHARLKEVPSICIALGLSRQGIEFHALDGHPVRAIFLVAGPPDCTDEYIEVMKTVSHMTQSEDFRRFLFKAEAAGEVVDLVREMSGKMR